MLMTVRRLAERGIGRNPLVGPSEFPSPRNADPRSLVTGDLSRFKTTEQILNRQGAAVSPESVRACASR